MLDCSFVYKSMFIYIYIIRSFIEFNQRNQPNRYKKGSSHFLKEINRMSGFALFAKRRKLAIRYYI